MVPGYIGPSVRKEDATMNAAGREYGDFHGNRVSPQLHGIGLRDGGNDSPAGGLHLQDITRSGRHAQVEETAPAA